MAEKSRFFDSDGTDNDYISAEFSEYFGALVSNGVFYNSPDVLKVIPGSGMSVVVSSGVAWINGRIYKLTDPKNIPLDPANTVARIDRIVLRLDLNSNARKITSEVIKGTQATPPAAPALTRAGNIYELCLANISVPAGAASILNTNITDTRLNQSLCGQVNSLVGAVYE